jgi:VanZ family protein
MIDFRQTSISILILATILLFTFVPRYQIDPTELLQNGDFQNGFASWEFRSDGGNRTGKTGVVTLENKNPTRTVFLHQKVFVPKVPLLMKFTGVIKTEGIVEGDSDWHRARLSLVSRDASGKSLWNYPHQIDIPLTTDGWQTFSQVFLVPSEAVEVVAGMEIIRATGTMRVQNMSLASAKEHPWFTIVANVLLFIWGVAFLWVGIFLLRTFKSPVIKGALGVASGLIFFGVGMPGWMKNLALDVILEKYSLFITYLSTVLPEANFQHQTASYPLIPPDKFGHFILFSLLAFICRMGRPNGSIQVLLINLMLFAATTEVLQFFAFSRSPRIVDWIIDVSGALSGLALSMLFYKNKINEKFLYGKKQENK